MDRLIVVLGDRRGSHWHLGCFLAATALQLHAASPSLGMLCLVERKLTTFLSIHEVTNVPRFAFFKMTTESGKPAIS